MKNLLLSLATIFSCFQIGYSQTAYSQALSCNSGSLSMGYVRQNPIMDSLSGMGGFSIESNFLKKQRRFFSTSFGIEANFGSRSFGRVIENIEFEGGYDGFASYTINRVDLGVKYIIGAQIGRIVEFTFPFRLGFRSTAYNQEFDLYPGQEIAEEDLVSDSEASEENTDAFFRSNKFGFGTGVNAAFLPNKFLSPFIEVGVNYFDGDELPMVDQASLSNGEVVIPRVNLSINNEVTFRVGVRINIGCPKSVTSIYQPPLNSQRTDDSHYREHDEVQTRIVRRVRKENTNAQNNSNESERVILKPQKPRTPRTPKD
jgi:hypothetical protein